ncbi:hypothetical protein BJ508DRAFT_309604 [Ascobolus immersus RN42]|uniref:Uncharacterized protein n=1 Tax=Ascobolus immersus RN42 TaxID=1160509 RepID=A0A3N4I190_ASCIM|nr:hypothetical protein BJ508DRAFT_309604 [Ascobolus immersus RN42]
MRWDPELAHSDEQLLQIEGPAAYHIIPADATIPPQQSIPSDPDADHYSRLILLSHHYRHHPVQSSPKFDKLMRSTPHHTPQQPPKPTLFSPTIQHDLSVSNALALFFDTQDDAHPTDTTAVHVKMTAPNTYDIRVSKNRPISAKEEYGFEELLEAFSTGEDIGEIILAVLSVVCRICRFDMLRRFDAVRWYHAEEILSRLKTAASGNASPVDSGQPESTDNYESEEQPNTTDVLIPGAERLGLSLERYAYLLFKAVETTWKDIPDLIIAAGNGDEQAAISLGRMLEYIHLLTVSRYIRKEAFEKGVYHWTSYNFKAKLVDFLAYFSSVITCTAQFHPDPDSTPVQLNLVVLPCPLETVSVNSDLASLIKVPIAPRELDRLSDYFKASILESGQMELPQHCEARVADLLAAADVKMGVVGWSKFSATTTLGSLTSGCYYHITDQKKRHIVPALLPKDERLRSVIMDETERLFGELVDKELRELRSSRIPPADLGSKFPDSRMCAYTIGGLFADVEEKSREEGRRLQMGGRRVGHRVESRSLLPASSPNCLAHAHDSAKFRERVPTGMRQAHGMYRYFVLKLTDISISFLSEILNGDETHDSAQSKELF